MIEIERKFLVNATTFLEQATGEKKIKQGYLTKDPERTVRVRIMDQQAFLTIKGASDAAGLMRFEWEKEIPMEEAEALLKLALPTVIEKIRYTVPHGQYILEVDVFDGQHNGLILCEVELNSPQDTVVMPSWVGKEVTGDPTYYNSALSSAGGETK